MLDIALGAVQGALLALVAYQTITAAFGWPAPRPATEGRRRRRFRVVVPAHDEAGVIERIVNDVTDQEYPEPLVEIYVIADRCSDQTAAIASVAGALVEERFEGSPGKGAAIAWHLDRHPLSADEALVVFDADTRIDATLLGRFADELDAGHQALQAYLDVANPDTSSLATAGALSYWASNRMVQQARRRLGWPADLGGTGMCITAAALEAAGGFTTSLAEDADLGARLARHGIPVTWLHTARILDQKPDEVGVTVRQRARWARGKRSVARHHALPLLGRAFKGSAGSFDLALRLVQPSRTMVAFVSGAAMVAALIADPAWLLPAWVWAAATLVQLLLPVAFLIRDGVPARYVIRFPLLTLLVILWLPIRLVSRFVRPWYHTPHD